MANADSIPVVDSLSSIYSSDALEKQEGRWQRLRETFKEVYGHPPDFIARAPGRVNLIGEHIDYMYLPCIPMATQVDVLLATSTRTDGNDADSDTVTATNIDSNYKKQTFRPHIADKGDDVEVEPPIDRHALNWCNYVKCGYRGAMTSLREGSSNLKPVKVNLLCDGTVPRGSGLSSSSALTTASALATFAIHGRGLGTSKDTGLEKEKLTSVAIVSERGVGVSSGGMDQTASVYSQKGSAILVQFRPKTSAEPVPLPGGGKEGEALQCVIANSLETSNKHETAKTGYNLRVVECQVASYLMAKHLNVKPVKTLKEVLDQMRGQGDEEKLVSLKEQLDDIYHGFTNNGYSQSDMVTATGLSEEQFHKEFLTDFPGKSVATHQYLEINVPLAS